MAVTAARPSVVQIRKGTAGTPLYFIEAGSAELHLAQLMSIEHSIFATECYPWPLVWRTAAAENKTYALPTTQQLAAPYVSAISVHARSLPYVLAGYSFGGVIAFEAAHQLRQLGSNVEMVILLDSQAKQPLAPGQVAWRLLTRDWEGASNSPLATSRLTKLLYVIKWIRRKQIGWLRRRLRQTLQGDLGPMTHRFDDLGKLPWVLVERVYHNALRSYSLRKLDCCGVLFRSDVTVRSDLSDYRFEQHLDGSLGWQGLFGRGMEIIQMTGDHHSMMGGPHNLMLAQEISHLLNRFLA